MPLVDFTVSPGRACKTEIVVLVDVGVIHITLVDLYLIYAEVLAFCASGHAILAGITFVKHVGLEGIAPSPVIPQTNQISAYLPTGLLSKNYG